MKIPSKLPLFPHMPRASRNVASGSRRQAVASILGLGAGLVGTLTGCDKKPTPSASIPAFHYTLLDGIQRHSDGLRGKVVLVNFWATTCAVCLREMPRIVATHRQFNTRGLETLAVSMRYDPPARVASYAQATALPFGVAIDNTGAIEQAFGGVRGTPTSLLMDRQGRVIWRHEGEPDFDALHGRLESLLGPAGPVTA